MFRVLIVEQEKLEVIPKESYMPNLQGTPRSGNPPVQKLWLRDLKVLGGSSQLVSG